MILLTIYVIGFLIFWAGAANHLRRTRAGLAEPPADFLLHGRTFWSWVAFIGAALWPIVVATAIWQAVAR